MAAPKVACVLDYLGCVEEQRLERLRHDRIEKQLMDVLKASDSIDLERKMLTARSKALHPSLTLVHLLSQQAVILDAANSKLEAAEHLQQLRIKQQQAEFDQVFLNTDC
jgi:hypothetical protein